MFIRLDTIPAFYGRTDRQNWFGKTLSCSAYYACWHDLLKV